jgi:hypothetical protein
MVYACTANYPFGAALRSYRGLGYGWSCPSIDRRINVVDVSGRPVDTPIIFATTAKVSPWGGTVNVKQVPLGYAYDVVAFWPDERVSRSVGKHSTWTTIKPSSPLK